MMHSNRTSDGTQPAPTTDKALDKANIDNLTALWRAMGATAHNDTQPGLQACPGWPHRFWFDGRHAMLSTPQLHGALAALPARAMVPVWHLDNADSPLERTLRQLGYTVALEQRAMHLSRWREFPASSLALRPVLSGDDLNLWALRCGEAFGYPIDSDVITHLARDDRASLWLAENGDEAIATALLFRTGGVVGIHQVGVPAAHRGRGIARALMQTLMNQCHGWGAKSLVLQASAAGEGLYRQLGFQQRFLLRSYQRQ